jgi:hypothetical protein
MESGNMVFVEMCGVDKLFIFAFTFRGIAQICHTGGFPSGGSLGFVTPKINL